MHFTEILLDSHMGELKNTSLLSIRCSCIFKSMQLNLLRLFLIHLCQSLFQFHWRSRMNSVLGSTLFGEYKTRKYLSETSKQAGKASQHHVLEECHATMALQMSVVKPTIVLCRYSQEWLIRLLCLRKELHWKKLKVPRHWKGLSISQSNQLRVLNEINGVYNLHLRCSVKILSQVHWYRNCHIHGFLWSQ